VYHLYTVRVQERKVVQEHLRSRGIASGVYYPLPPPEAEPYRHLGHAPEAFPEAQRAARETLAIPLYPEMTEGQIEAVASAVREASAGVAGPRR
jgi:dTDP-4-amino-4,6-dideoxygalactose transaminase